MVLMRDSKTVKAAHEPGSAGTLAGGLAVEIFAGKGAGARRNGAHGTGPIPGAAGGAHCSWINSSEVTAACPSQK